MARRATLIVLAALTLVVGACGDDDASTVEDASTPVETTTTTVVDPNAPCDPATFDPAELEPVVAVSVPLGFEQQPDDVADTGPSNFDKAVRDEDEPDAVEALTATGFVRGYQRLWLNSANVKLIGFVYEFCHPAGATAYAERYARLASASTGMPSFVVEGLPGATGNSAQGTGAGAMVSVARDRYVVATLAAGTHQGFEVDDVERLTTDLAVAMIDQLPTDA